MSKSDWPAADISELDQGMAEASEQLDMLVGTLRGTTAEQGEPQALATLFGLMSVHMHPADALTLLVVALARLAKQENKKEN